MPFISSLSERAIVCGMIIGGSHRLLPITVLNPCLHASVPRPYSAEDLTREGMLAGVLGAGAFILFLSAGVLNRPFCQAEIRHAMEHGKPLVLIHEADVSANA